jgi:hypothetical protein
MPQFEAYHLSLSVLDQYNPFGSLLAGALLGWVIDPDSESLAPSYHELF